MRHLFIVMVRSYHLIVLCAHRLLAACHHRYYHNYRVHKASSQRTYYGGVPEILQVAQHFFFESALLELFATAMVFGW
jgi:hypothetical protein